MPVFLSPQNLTCFMYRSYFYSTCYFKEENVQCIFRHRKNFSLVACSCPWMQTVHQFVCGFPPVNFCKKLALTENCRGGRNLEDVVISAAAFLVVPQNNLLAFFPCRTLSKVGLEISQLNQSLTLSLLFSFRHCTTFMVQPFHGKVKAKSIGSFFTFNV